MRRFGRSPRRPDHWASTHERARARAAERISGELGPTEAAWLDAHLAGCRACTSIAAAYDADRLALRALRDLPAQPPRDLWARTAAAVERESAARHGSPAGTRRGPSRLPLGTLSGIAVIAVVVGVSTLASTITTSPSLDPDQEPGQRSTTGGDNGSEFSGANATPFAVGAGEVEYLMREANGLLAVNKVPIDEVCPAEGTAGCPALRDAASQRLALAESPRTIISSPTDRNAIVVAKGADNGDELFVVALPASASNAPSVAASEPPATFNPVEGTRPPVTTAAPLASATTESARPSMAASDAPPSSAAETTEPSASPGIDTAANPSADPSAEATPALTPEPSVATSLAIASDIEVVGEAAAFSADGAWFAFTARPADGSGGPDVYVWRVGEAKARNLTEDGGTVFASWDGEAVVASRPKATTTGATESPEPPVTPTSVRIDPVSGVETPAGDVWLPAVDPTRSRAITWNGSIERASDGTTWAPLDGRLELQAWSAEAGGQTSGGPVADDDRIVTDELSHFDIRWDETGEWVAVWIADTEDPNMGRLSLYRVDQDTGRLERLDDAPDGVAALPGFSIAQGRLAWASPPGQEGEGSRIRIVAWSGEGVGSVESAPGEDIIIIR